MAELKKIKDRLVLDYMSRDFDSIMESMYAVIPELMPNWKDFRNEADFGNVLLQLFAHMGDMLSYYQDRIANESFLATAQSRVSVIHHLRLIGYHLSTAAPASVNLKLIFNEKPENTIIIKKGDAFSVKSGDSGPMVRFEYTNDAPLNINPDTLIKDHEGKFSFDGIPVEEGRLIMREYIGVSENTPNQRFALGHPGIIMKSRGDDRRITEDIIITGEMGSLIQRWFQKEYLLYCDASYRGFTIDIDEFDRTTVLFGDGIYGAIPPRGTKLYATYRIGGGTNGNIPPGQEWSIESSALKNAPVSKIINQKAAVGGASRESIEHAVKHAPGIFRAKKRAVTAEDYKELALNFRGVGKVFAKALNVTTVNLYVAPQGGGYVTDTLEANLLAYFEDKRPVSTRIQIVDVTYIPVYVTACIRVESYYLESEIIEKVRAAGKELLSFENVDFGQAIYISKFYEAIEAIDGVAHVVINEFTTRHPTGLESKGLLKFKESQIPAIPMDQEYSYGIKVVLESGI